LNRKPVVSWLSRREVSDFARTAVLAHAAAALFAEPSRGPVGGGQDTGLQLVERKALLEPLVAGKPGLQFNGHETGDGELILKHAGRLVLRSWCQRRSTPLTCQETAAYGAKLNG
jgi:hypothetical protein